MSKKEADYAQDLDLRLRAKDIKAWIPQFRLNLVVNGLPICTYVVDFLVINNDDTEEIHEVKGYATDLWKIKWKLAEALFGNKYKMVLINE